MAKLQENDEEVLEVFYKRKCLKKSDLKDLKENYPDNIKRFNRNKFIDGTCITERGKSAFKQHIATGSYWVAPLRKT